MMFAIVAKPETGSLNFVGLLIHGNCADVHENSIHSSQGDER